MSQVLLAFAPPALSDGECQALSYVDELGLSHVVRVCGDIGPSRDIPVHIQGECGAVQSGDCDCRQQLLAAMLQIASGGLGVVIGLAKQGHGPQEAGTLVGEADPMPDCALSDHSYDVVARILRWLGARRVHLLSQNPTKARGLLRNGILVTARDVPGRASAHLDGQALLHRLEHGGFAADLASRDVHGNPARVR